MKQTTSVHLSPLAGSAVGTKFLSFVAALALVAVVVYVSVKSWIEDIWYE